MLLLCCCCSYYYYYFLLQPFLLSPTSVATVSNSTNLNWWFPGDVRDEKVHGDVLAIPPLVHMVTNRLWHHLAVQVEVVLQRGKASQP